MERKRSKLQASLLLWATVAVLLSQNLLVSAISAATVEDQKNYYPPDPNAGTPHTGSPSHNPPHSSGGGHGSTPSHGGGSYGTPSHGGGSYGTPSHGGGSYGTPPANCGTPPSEGPATPTPSTPSGGGGSYQPPPTTPSTPTPIVNPPTIVSPPTTPGIEPGTPTIPGVTVPPAPPYGFDPNSPPFSCNYWRTHPTLIWGLLGWWGTVGQTLGATSIPGFGSNMSVLQALSNTRTDGFGALYREGTASFLNSMVHRNFPYTTQQVRDTFVGALSSNKAAAHQAQLFKLANEGRVKA